MARGLPKSREEVPGRRGGEVLERQALQPGQDAGGFDDEGRFVPLPRPEGDRGEERGVRFDEEPVRGDAPGDVPELPGLGEGQDARRTR